MKVKRIDSSDENVSKYVYDFGSAVAEAVLYKYPTYEERTVICCSTQSGCPVGCRFCGAGDNFVRSLSGDEIVGQVQHLFADRSIDPTQIKRLQIMFMSMGEPLLNRNGLTDALRHLCVLYPKAALLISTSAPDVDYEWVREISVEIPTIGLQFSVHESTDQARDELIPFKAKKNLLAIANEGWRWHQATGRQPFFNYCDGDLSTGGSVMVSDAKEAPTASKIDVVAIALEIMRQSDMDWRREPVYENAARLAYEALSSVHRETLIQLLFKGPIWDGDILSKSARDYLISVGLATRCCYRGEQGYAIATYQAFSIYNRRANASPTPPKAGVYQPGRE